MMIDIRIVVIFGARVMSRGQKGSFWHAGQCVSWPGTSRVVTGGADLCKNSWSCTLKVCETYYTQVTAK